MYLLPQPKKITEQTGIFLIDYKIYIVLEPGLAKQETIAGRTVRDTIRQWIGYEAVLSAGQFAEGDIYMELCEKLGSQEYRLEVKEKGVFIQGGSAEAVFYGAQTLSQLIRQYGALIPCVHIEDKPDHLYRGYYFDQTRGRVLKLEELKRLVDRMSSYKLNQLQLYIEHTYLFRDFSELWRDQTPITADEILELDAYCRERHVELVPSLACFGHLYGLLSTRTHGDICEMSDSWKRPFSFYDRMRYHTVNVTDERSFALIRDMILEYMQLFSTDKFNICADETFYLGKEKSKKAADEVGVQRLYVDFLKKLCGLIVENGKIPMFWGDIICRSPELVKELPESTICLNWGYAADQSGYNTEVMAEAGAIQYVCPGVGGWNEWVNLIENSFKNIVLMCSYAHKYGAVGVLNTDWGDFGHINDPEYSLPGMIYGAALSWNSTKTDFEEMNRQISLLEYSDATKKYVSYLAGMADLTLFHWRDAVLYCEVNRIGQMLNDDDRITVDVPRDSLLQSQKRLENLHTDFLKTIRQIRQPHAVDMEKLSVTLEAISLWNEIGYVLTCDSKDGENGVEKILAEEKYDLAERLEKWFMYYKKMWRRTGREGDLRHISDIVFWYADLLREK